MAPSGVTPDEATATSFLPALIVVDMQEDFCPPNGPLAVQGARTLAPVINTLLSLPGFVLKISTQDFHPQTHISFAPNHPPPDNIPFKSTIAMKNPKAKTKTGDDAEPEQTKPQLLWPIHCVANTPGACLIPEIQADKIGYNIYKGMDARVEMYSAFADAFGNDDCVGTGGVNMDLAELLRGQEVTDVFVVGVAGDYCVRDTAVDAAKRGFRAWVVEEGVKCVDPEEGWEGAKRVLAEFGIGVVGIEGEEVGRVRGLGKEEEEQEEDDN
ncbi:hypothetical protein AJ79_04279 [Helicocarpus griseus UAMH5409]|uniref:nicotinamidase n=1 Tax=Helicocarpus griseus UAMH5409 TaxID=1447875 RepID=A0A2B7XUK3_9EURO|nr:hypothetical protein AJ79_04279 [Helicocarpus griseus UAMH5409]